KVVVFHRADAAQQRELIHDLRLPWHEFANAHAVEPGGNRVERTAIFAWRVRLEVVHVDVTGTAAEHDVDDGLGAPRLVCPGIVAQQIGQRQPAQAERSELEEITAIDAVARFLAIAPKGQHRWASKVGFKTCEQGRTDVGSLPSHFAAVSRNLYIIRHGQGFS